MNTVRARVALIVAAIGLVACGDDTEQRRFATDEQPSFVAASPSAAATLTVPPAPVASAALSPQALFASTESPSTVFIARQDGVWWINAASGDARLVVPASGDGAMVMATDLAGERTAILSGGGSSPDTPALIIVGPDGSTLQRFDDVAAPFGKASNEVVPVSLDWSRDGRRLLAAFRGGGLLDVPLQGEPSVILGPERLPYVVSARWSPTSDLIAYVARTKPDGPGRLFVAKPRGGATDPVVLAPARTATGQSVRELAWAQNGESILYLQSSDSTEITSQDLFAIRPSGEERRLVASGGRVAPVGGIELFAVSQDGQSVAYTVYVPGPTGPVFNSLWIESLKDEHQYRVPLSSADAVTALRWVTGGLLWQTTTTSDSGTPVSEETALYRLTGDLEPRRVDAAGGTPGSASPVPSSPVASSPVAVASPGPSSPES